VSTSLHHLFDDGNFAVAVPTDSPTAALVTAAGRTGVPALVELTDQAPLPLREPVRALVWMRGNIVAAPDYQVRAMVDVIAGQVANPALLDIRTDRQLRTQPGSTLLCLKVESVVVADSTGAESVDVATLLDARPDPFCTLEAGWLSHIEYDHRDLIDRLARRLPLSLQHGQVHLLGIDRYGIQLRVEGSGREDPPNGGDPRGDHDVRLPFAEPVHDTVGLSQALRILAGCPFLNGLRARKI
jgi:hypothetical protein